MQSNYPSPCLRCSRADTCVGYTGPKGRHLWCQRYETWFKWWWKYFRKVATIGPRDLPDDPSKFRYSHPDRVKQYLQEGPCAKCSAQEYCDNPCKAYLRWYDARMEITRKKVGV